MITKICTKCSQNLPIINFYKANKGLHKVQTYCKQCQKIFTETWRKSNQQKVNKWARTKAKTISYRYKTAIRTAKKRKLQFNLTLEQYSNLVLQPCTYCNNQIGTVSTGTGLDRLNNDVGYVFDNVVSCCQVCNKIRNVYLTPEETKHVISALLDFRKAPNK